MSSDSGRLHKVSLLFLKLGLMSFSLLLVLAVFELGFRLAGYEAIYEIYSKPSVLWRTDPLLGWSHEPDSTDVFVGPRPWPIEFETPIRINSLGLRGPEIPPREEDDVRILFLGDSMVAALEVEYDQTFPQLIAQELSERTGRRIRAINAGVRGYGTDQSYLYFRDRGRHLDSDVVVFFHTHNDLENNRTIHRMRRAMGKSAFVLDSDGKLELKGSPVGDYPECSAYAIDERGEIIRRDGLLGRGLCRLQMVLFDRSALFSYITLRVDWNPILLRNLYYLAIPTDSEAGANHDVPDRSRPVTLALLEELRRDVEASGARLVVVGKEKWLEHDFGLETLRGMGIVVSPIMTPTEEEEPHLHFLRDSHFNVAGHRRVADQLLPVIESTVASVTNREGGE